MSAVRLTLTTLDLLSKFSEQVQELQVGDAQQYATDVFETLEKLYKSDEGCFDSKLGIRRIRMKVELKHL